MNTSLQLNPLLPGALRLPLRLMPPVFYNQVFCRALTSLFAQALTDGELDFLQQRRVAIHITDAGLKFTFTLEKQKITSLPANSKADLTMQGSMYHFLLMLSRREDPDTLFFNRRLKLSGDTELGLYVKNFLDSIELTDRWKYMHLLSDKARIIAERIG